MIRIIKTIIKLAPVIGDAIDNRDSEEGGKGKFHWGRLVEQILRVAGTALITYLTT